MVPPPLVSSPRRLSGPYISGAISSAASPLRGSFSLSCRSPVRPTYDADARRSSSVAAGSPFLKPPSFLPARTGSPKASWNSAQDHDDYGSEDASLLSDESPTDQTWFLQPQTPGLSSPRSAFQRDEGKLGVISAINIIVGKTVGVGAYSVPSAIFAGVGSVGMTLLIWVIGSLISFCGLAVYLDLGTAIPRSGGERVYLERIFRRPRMLATCMFMAYVVLLGFSTPNAIVLGEYVLYALDAQPNRWNVRAIAVAIVTLLCYIHARYPKLGLRLINVLGVTKMLILVIVILSGVAGALMGVGTERELLMARRLDVSLSDVAPRSTAQRNFSDVWAGSSTQPYDYATALMKVIYCFRGYSTANQVLSDVRNPVRTLKIAAPIALSLVSLAYLALNVAFFLVVDKDDFKSAGVVVAGIFFRNVFGPGAGAHILPLFVIISAAGNIAATSFAQARVNEELAKDGLLPWSGFWTSKPPPPPPPPPPPGPVVSHPDITIPNELGKLYPAPPPHVAAAAVCRFHAAQERPAVAVPSRGLLLHWFISVLVIVLPPPGPIYNFLVDVGGYPVGIISVAVSAGLLYLHYTPGERWSPPYRAPRFAVMLFAASNCLLLILPWVPPVGGRGEDAAFIWCAYPATALTVLASGAIWWLWWSTFGNGSASAQKKGLYSRLRSSGGPATHPGRSSGESSTMGERREEREDDGMSIPVEEMRSRAPCGCLIPQESSSGT